MDNKLFAQRLKILRAEKGINQIQLAEVLGISKGAVGHFESAKRNPSIENLGKLSEYFNVSTDYIIGKSDFRDKEEAATYLLNKLKEEDLIKETDGKVNFKDLDAIIQRIKLANEIKNT